jgi:hypothetical protein
MSDLLILTTLTKGTSSHPRFVIADQFGRVWTGKAWSGDENDGRLFADWNDLGDECRDILLAQAAAKPVFRFAASIEMEIRGDRKPDLIDLIVWTIRAVRLSVDYRQHGTGPASESVATLRIDWGTLKEIKQ